MTADSVEQEEYEHAYEAAKAAGLDPNNITDTDLNDPSKVTVVRWIMSNTQCGWLIGKGGSGIQNIEVCTLYTVCVLSSHLFWTSGLWTYQPGSHRSSALDKIRKVHSVLQFIYSLVTQEEYF